MGKLRSIDQLMVIIKCRSLYDGEWVGVETMAFVHLHGDLNGKFEPLCFFQQRTAETFSHPHEQLTAPPPLHQSCDSLLDVSLNVYQLSCLF